MAKANPAFAQIIDHRRPMLPMTDGIKSAVVAGAHAGATLAAGKVGIDVDENREQAIRNEEETPTAWQEQQPEVTDGGMSWGKSGQTETTHERGAESIPLSAMESLGIQPQQSSSTTPEPATLGRPLQPDSPSGSSGNWNASDIFRNTRIGG